MADSDISKRLGELRIDRKQRAARPHRRPWLIALGTAVLIVLIAALVLFRRPPVVSVAQVRQARVGEQQTELTASGYVASRRRSIVAPKVPGRLDQLLVNEGQQVQQGQVIARLDPKDAQIALERAVAEARAAQGALAAAQAERARTARELTRARDLARAGAVARQSFDEAQSAFEAADAQTQAARSRLAAARDAVSAAQLGVENTIVRAPFNGTVVRKLADEGAVLAPATIAASDVGGIVELVDLGQLEVEAEVSENDLARIRIGQPALIFLDAWPQRVWRGVAESIRPAVDRSKATGVVKVRFDDPPQGVLPDMAARVSFLSRPVPGNAMAEGSRLRVPASAVVEREGEPVLLAVNNGRVREVPVQPGQRVGNEIALNRGPPPGTQVVEAPKRRLGQGDKIRVATGAR